MWDMIILWVVTTLISYALRPKPPAGPPPAGLSDFQMPTAEDGREIPVLFGTRKITGANVVWYGDLRVVPVQKKGGKK
jgi:hypothetical protein